jgi:hypothetical protein
VQVAAGPENQNWSYAVSSHNWNLVAHIPMRNCIVDEAKNRAVSSRFSGATETDFALLDGSLAATVEGTERVQARGSRHAISALIFCC